jgi:hypothetical protein
VPALYYYFVVFDCFGDLFHVLGKHSLFESFIKSSMLAINSLVCFEAIYKGKFECLNHYDNMTVQSPTRLKAIETGVE